MNESSSGVKFSLRKYALAFFLAALGGRLLLLAAFEQKWPILGPFAHGSVASNFTHDFWGIAKNVVEGKGFSWWLAESKDWTMRPTAFYSPGQPLVYAAILKLAPEKYFLAAKIFQSFLLALAFALLGIYFERTFGTRVAVAAFAIMNLNPFLGVAHLMYTDTACTVLLSSIVLLLLLRLLEKPSAGRAAALGLVFGTLLLFNPSYVFVGIVAMVWMLASRRVKWPAVAVVCLVAAAALSPWAIRNYFLFHKFIPVRSAYKIVFWMGSNPRATGGPMMVGSTDIAERNPDDQLVAEMKGMNELEVGDHLYAKAKTFIKENPGRFLQLRLNAWVYYWTTQAYWINPLMPARRVLFGLTLLHVALSFLGMFLAVRDRRPHALFLTVGILAFAGTYALCLGDYYERYRLAMDPLLAVFEAYALCKMVSWRGKTAAG